MTLTKADKLRAEEVAHAIKFQYGEVFRRLAEDEEDIAAAEEALKDGKFIPWEQVKEELGL